MDRESWGFFLTIKKKDSWIPKITVDILAYFSWGTICCWPSASMNSVMLLNTKIYRLENSCARDETLANRLQIGRFLAILQEPSRRWWLTGWNSLCILVKLDLCLFLQHDSFWDSVHTPVPLFWLCPLLGTPISIDLKLWVYKAQPSLKSQPKCQLLWSPSWFHSSGKTSCPPHWAPIELYLYCVYL